VKGGRPLWFLLAVIGGWGTLRGIALYRDHRDWVPNRAPHPPAVSIAAAPLWPRARAIPLFAASSPYRLAFGAVPRRYPCPSRSLQPAFVTAGHRRGAAMPRVAITPMPEDVHAPASAPPAILTLPSRRSRLAGSAWLIARAGGAIALPGSQLGASQTGLRVTYAIRANRRLALSARLSAPLSGPGREAAIGVDWQPTRAPLHLVVERRFALDGGRGGTMVGAIGGFGPREMAPGVVLEGYAQAGAVLRARADAFADGALRAAHPFAAIGAMRIDGGGGIWGGVQRGAGRLDIGPSLGLAMPLGGRTFRLTADWRQRIAGPSRPDSGPALSIGTDF